jgi:hypothetical protein
MRSKEDIHIDINVRLQMRERGKLVHGSIREGHNVFTVNGMNWLSTLMAWQTISGLDVPYTNRRVRWMGAGSGTQLESANVSLLAYPILCTTTNYLQPVQSVSFPSSTSVQFTKEFGASEITIAGAPVAVSEIGLYADVSPANNGAINDVSYNPSELPSATMLDPTVGTNPLIAYKTFEPLTKTIDFSLLVNWEFLFV